MQKLTRGEFDAVQRAILAGMRQTDIARELDLSVWTIARIAADMRFVTDVLTDEQLPVDDAPPDYLARNLRRCAGCGAMIYVSPCIACQMATLTQRVPPAPEVDDDGEDDRQEPAAENGSRARLLTAKQRRWRRKQIRRLVFGEGEAPAEP